MELLKEREHTIRELEQEVESLRGSKDNQLKELSDEVAIITQKLK